SILCPYTTLFRSHTHTIHIHWKFLGKTVFACVCVGFKEWFETNGKILCVKSMFVCVCVCVCAHCVCLCVCVCVCLCVCIICVCVCNVRVIYIYNVFVCVWVCVGVCVCVCNVCVTY